MLPCPGRGTLVGLATALAAGDVALHPGADRDRETARLLALPGIGPWTAGYIRMRALSEPDAFLPTDVGVIRALTVGTVPGAPAPVRGRAARFAASLPIPGAPGARTPSITCGPP